MTRAVQFSFHQTQLTAFDSSIPRFVFSPDPDLGLSLHLHPHAGPNAKYLKQPTLLPTCSSAPDDTAVNGRPSIEHAAFPSNPGTTILSTPLRCIQYSTKLPYRPACSSPFAPPFHHRTNLLDIHNTTDSLAEPHPNCLVSPLLCVVNFLLFESLHQLNALFPQPRTRSCCHIACGFQRPSNLPSRLRAFDAHRNRLRFSSVRCDAVIHSQGADLARRARLPLFRHRLPTSI